jgi:N-acyl-D-amino-acid deacylase
MEEAFAIGRHAKAPVVVSHHKCAGVRNWGRTVETLAVLDRARRSQQVVCDCYPYAASSSTLDLKQVTADFEIAITWSKPHPEMAGRTLQQIADAWGLPCGTPLFGCARQAPCTTTWTRRTCGASCSFHTP